MGVPTIGGEEGLLVDKIWGRSSSHDSHQLSDYKTLQISGHLQETDTQGIRNTKLT
jgi:hypothetical protein